MRRRPYRPAARAALSLLALAAAAVVPAVPAHADAPTAMPDSLTLRLDSCGPQTPGTESAATVVVTNGADAPAFDVAVTPADGMPPGVVVHDVGPAAPYLAGNRFHEYAATVTIAADAAPGWLSLPFDVTTSAGTVRRTVGLTVWGPPQAPTVNRVVPGDGRAAVEWQSPPDAYDWTRTDYYVVTARSDSATATATFYRSSGNTGWIALTPVGGLDNGTAYTFTVIAHGMDGSTATSAPFGPVTPAGPPLAPANVTATGDGTSRLVSWEAAGDNGSPVSGYTVTTYPGATTTQAGPDARSIEVPDLDPGTAYEFTVRATNAAGTGDESASTAGDRPSGLPGPFTGSITVTAPFVSWGRAAVAVHLTGLGSDGTRYQVEPAPRGVREVPADGGTASVTVDDLDDGTYGIRVRAVNALGPGPWSAPTTVSTNAADHVAGVYVLAGDGGVHACPMAARGRGVPATALVFRAYPWNSSALNVYPPTATVLGTWTFPPDTVDAWLPGLVNGKEYMVDVQVVTELGPGGHSAMSDGWSRPQGLPGAPGDVAATAGNGTATVSWTAADWKGGWGDYEVVASPGGATVRTSSLSAQVPGLAAGTAYTFAVRALSVTGSGPVATSAPVTPFGVPTAPAAVTATPKNGAAHVAWTAAEPNGSPVDHYTVTASPGGATTTVAGDTPAADLGGLANGTAYTVTVTAANAAGDGPPSAPSASVTPDGTAPAVTLHAVAPVTLSGSVPLSYPATDAGGSGVASTVVRYRAAPYDGPFGAFHSLGAVTVAPVSRGYTYCFSVAAADIAGNVAPWSAERCTVTPLDDRALSASPSWQRGTGASHYAGTFTATVVQGATLTRTGVSGRRLVLVHAAVPDGAALGVYLDGVLLKQVPTASAATAYRRVTTIDFGAVKSGTVTIRTLTGGRAYVDGLGVSRV